MTKMTDEERALAEANLWRVDRFLKIHRLDPDEWYDVAVFGFLEGIQYIIRNEPEIRSFTTVLKVCMKCEVLNEMNKQRSVKRGGGEKPLSLDAALKPEDDDGTTLADFIPAPGWSPEDRAVYKDLIERSFAAAYPRSAECMRYSVRGFDPEEIAQRMRIKYRSSIIHLYRFRQKSQAIWDDVPMTDVDKKILEHQREYARARYAAKKKAAADGGNVNDGGE